LRVDFKDENLKLFFIRWRLYELSNKQRKLKGNATTNKRYRAVTLPKYKLEVSCDRLFDVLMVEKNSVS
jgi:hypothetical protein